MTNYDSLKQNVEHIHTLIVDEMLKDIAFKQFEIDRGVAVHKVLPDRYKEYSFSFHNFNGHVSPKHRSFENPTYYDFPLSMNRICSEPQAMKFVINPLYDAWLELFEDDYHKEPPVSRDKMMEIIDEIVKQHEIVTTDPQLVDLLNAIQDKNHRLAAQFLNLDVEPLTLFEPGGSHELTELFTNGDIKVAYKDRDIALLKPTYNHGIREKVLNDQRDGWERVTLRGEQPELAFVIGIDDTPTGLFVHAVDGTRLDPNDDINREQIHDIMGFDVNYDKENVLDIEVNTRMRLQGDLAIEKVSDNIETTNTGQCNLPIDNHLTILNHGEVPENESTNEEPVVVNVPEIATANVMHDEHNTVSTDLTSGQYKFYLLDRGLKPPSERPNW